MTKKQFQKHMKSKDRPYWVVLDGKGNVQRTGPYDAGRYPDRKSAKRYMEQLKSDSKNQRVPKVVRRIESGIDRANKMLKTAANYQTEYWNSLRDLEKFVGFDIDVIDDLTEQTIESLFTDGKGRRKWITYPA